MVRVNAPCDEGVAPLVEALAEIKGLVTVDSCEDGPWGAHVFFTYGEGWQDLAALLQAMSTALSAPPLPCGYSFSMEWQGSNDRPRAQVALSPEHVACLADGVRRVAASLNARMIGLGHGR